MKGSVEFRAFEPADLSQVAHVHCRCFPETLLARSGEGVVSRYYLWLRERSRDSVFQIAAVDGRIVGFCVGGVAHANVNQFVVAHLTYIAAQVLLRPGVALAVMKQTLAGVRSRGKDAARANDSVRPEHIAQLPPFRIVWMAVDPRYRGHHLGQRLLQLTEDGASRLGHQMLYLRIAYGEANAPAVALVEKLGWRRFLENGEWRGRMVKQASGGVKPQESPITHQHVE